VSVGYGLDRLDLENRNQCECSEERKQRSACYHHIIRYHHYKPFSLSILVITEILVLEQLQNRRAVVRGHTSQEGKAKKRVISFCHKKIEMFL